MSTRERQYLQVVGRVRHGDVTVVQGAEILGLSERQMYRLLLRHRRDGDQGLIHRLRGRRSNRGYGEEVQKEVVRLYREAYADYGPTLFSEMLQERHHRTIDANTLRRWLKEKGLWAGMRAARRHRRKRERRAAIGDLLQFDGSFHDWFEGRRRACCLLVAIDDASGRIFMRFAESESLRAVLLTLWAYVEHYGIPRQFYTDHGSVFFGRGGRKTDVARALERLGVQMIYARSPQAKGRVERSNRTHQDRLIKALRREGISTIDEANRFLEKVYLRRHNARFATTDHLPDVHRPAAGLDLTNIFCFETRRTVYHDYTITLHATFIQLEQSDAPLPPPRNSVIVRQWLDGSLHIFWHERELAFAQLPHRPPPKPRQLYHPPASHPWHRSDLGDMRIKIRSRKSILASMKKTHVLPT